MREKSGREREGGRTVIAHMDAYTGLFRDNGRTAKYDVVQNGAAKALLRSTTRRRLAAKTDSMGIYKGRIGSGE